MLADIELQIHDMALLNLLLPFKWETAILVRVSEGSLLLHTSQSTMS